MARAPSVRKPSPKRLSPTDNVPPPNPQLVDDNRPCDEYQYAVKVVAGIATVDNFQVAPGRYYTAINVHNPATCKTVSFRWKFAAANPLGQPMGAISSFNTVTLRPDQAVELDRSKTSFLKGWVVIESPCELDVVAVYTGGPARGTQVSFFATERVTGRQICACRDDLQMDISTGFADWMLISATDPSGGTLPGIVTPRSANVMDDADRHLGGPKNWGTQSGANWISVRGTAANVPPGTYTFQYCFSLCSSFENADITLSILVDNSATVWLNNNLAASTVTGFGSPTKVNITNQSWFLPGLNCLTFVVVNNPLGGTSPDNPMGLNVVGSVSATRGACTDCCGCCSDCGAQQVFPQPGQDLAQKERHTDY